MKALENPEVLWDPQSFRGDNAEILKEHRSRKVHVECIVIFDEPAIEGDVNVLSQNIPDRPHKCAIVRHPAILQGNGHVLLAKVETQLEIP